MSSSSRPKKNLTRSLRPRARILRTFGDELISSETVAVIELVKNAYDADATRVVVRFVPPLEKNEGGIDVLDDGHGMSMETIESTWMEPATLHRVRATQSESGLRRVLGEKGIGRFATSRLADTLEVITCRAKSGTATHVRFDWTQFDDPEKYLDEIKAEWWETTPSDLVIPVTEEALHSVPEDNGERSAIEHGTILRMRNLRADWRGEDLAELRTGLARLVSPFLETESLENRFVIELDCPDPFQEFSGRVGPPETLSKPPYSLKGSVSVEGKYKFSILVAGEQTIKSGRLPVVNDKLESGPFEIELRVWDRDPDALGALARERGSTLKNIRQDLDNLAGINIYRDGFRVLPYGEPRNDWLRLDLRRVNNPTLRLSNNQIVGYVLISADENPNLRDQSNREGLIENQAFSDLRSGVEHAMEELEGTRYKARRPTTQSRTRKGLFSNVDVSRVQEVIRERYPSDSSLNRLVAQVARGIEHDVEEAQETIARFRRLATLGQLIDAVLHDGRAPLAKIDNEAVLALRDIRNNQNGALVPKLGKRLGSIRTQADVLSITFRKIEPFGGRRRGRPRQVALEQILRDSFGVLETEISRVGASITLPSGETIVTVDQAELQEVFINLLQNSLYWLKRVPDDERRISVSVRRFGSSVRILFSDSGPGVDPENAEYIFDPYFSTKTRGVGLGLAIAGEIVNEYYDGALELVDSELGGATFRITLRRRI